MSFELLGGFWRGLSTPTYYTVNTITKQRARPQGLAMYLNVMTIRSRRTLRTIEIYSPPITP